MGKFKEMFLSESVSYGELQTILDQAYKNLGNVNPWKPGGQNKVEFEYTPARKVIRLREPGKKSSEGGEITADEIKELFSWASHKNVDNALKSFDGPRMNLKEYQAKG